MLFNTAEFAVFLFVVFGLYWAVFARHTGLRNAFILVASYVFYGAWDVRFLALIAFSTLVDYAVGRALWSTAKPSRRKLLLGVSLAVNLGLLGYFKYANFFIDAFVDLSENLFGYTPATSTLAIILPVGISFYTFQTLSYTIDVYRRKLEPTKNLVKFAAFVAFFPQLVAGPIERATNLLPQFDHVRPFTYRMGSTGMRLIVWGLFKKMVIADNCAPYVNEIFWNYQELSAPVLQVGAVLFAFQIYGDFSGYSDIAIGTARLLGFDLMTNFRYPYFSRDVAEFWRRWHISLSTWFRDYVYIPLGGSRRALRVTLVNTFIVFVVSGFWHGANWTFLVWGGLNALYIMPVVAMKKNRRHLDTVAQDRRLPRLGEGGQMLLTFALTCLAWVFFRAENVRIAVDYLFRAATDWRLPDNFYFFPPWLCGLIAFQVVVEWMARRTEPERWMGQLTKSRRYVLYVMLFVLWFMFAATEAEEFIYFQF